ncbi:MAG TPA: deoxynucleoside kinase [Trueperaceae bacterium]|nr:deoxynucleoside kinase [Trueperaceae bacterium]
MIVIEGPIGVGKTSLARLLSERLGARLLLEVVEENPFLASFYQNPERYAFQTETFFLLSRFKQHAELSQSGLFQAHTVADYLFDKTFLFASLNLHGDEFTLYRTMFDQLRSRLPDPDLTVYLRAEPELLLERIAQRGRAFESQLQASYLARLNEAYDRYFDSARFPVEFVDAGTLDFVANERDREALLGRLAGTFTGAGVPTPAR